MLGMDTGTGLSSDCGAIPRLIVVVGLMWASDYTCCYHVIHNIMTSIIWAKPIIAVYFDFISVTIECT